MVGFLVAKQMALQLDAHIAASEESDEAIQKAAHAVVPAVEQRRASERHQPSGPAFKLFKAQRAFALAPHRAMRGGDPAGGGAHLHARHEAAEILITLLRLDKHRQRPATATAHRPRRHRDMEIVDCVLRASVSPWLVEGCFDRQLGANDGAQSRLPRRLVESRRAVDTIGIQQRQRRVAERGGAFDQRFRQRGAMEKAEGGRTMKFDIHGKQ